MKKIIIPIILILILIILVGGFFALRYVKALDTPFDSTNEETSIIEIPMGSSTEDIGIILKENGIIDDEFKFKLFSRLNKYDGTYSAGTYLLSPSMSKTELCDIISEGRIMTFNFTIPEGFTTYEIVDYLSASGFGDREVFERLMNGDVFKEEFPFLKDVPEGATPMEGYLLPETYTLPYGSTEEDIIRAMLSGFQSVYDESIDGNLDSLGLSLHELMTIAAIVEEETYHSEDMPLVSSVIYNRLDVGMKLQMDPTVIYAMKENKLFLTYDDIAIESPYNTYYVEGLPIGPICCPGREAIEASINPADTEYYYFVVSDKGDGSIKFSEDYDEFERDKEAYYAAVEKENENIDNEEG